MAARGKSGIEINLDLVPVREERMSAYEIMLSESQERMLVVAKKGKESDIKAIFQKWDLNCIEIGKVTSGGNMKVWMGGKVVADIPADDLVLGGGAPVYTRERRRPAYLDETQAFDFNRLPQPRDYNDVLMKLVSSHNIASKRWVFEQYDSMVRTNTVTGPGSDAAVIRIRHTPKALALATDCNARYCYLNPRLGAQISVAESARNCACSGALPVAITNCLNFGNPYKPEMYYMFAEAVAGMGEACRVLETPVTGGNVSFYNEDPERAVYPTPTIGMLGIIDDIAHVTTSNFKSAGDLIALAGTTKNELGGSEYVKEIHGLVTGDAPTLDLDFEKRMQRFVLEAIKGGLVKSAHDISEGGLAVALAECCFEDREHLIGAKVEFKLNMRLDALYFGESQSRVILSINPASRGSLTQLAASMNIPMAIIGEVTGDRLQINGDIDAPVAQLSDGFYESIGKAMHQPTR
jgi:phosphoribosylformylglycinamidine synthase